MVAPTSPFRTEPFRVPRRILSSLAAVVLLSGSDMAWAKPGGFLIVTYGDQIADIGAVVMTQSSRALTLTHEPEVRVGYLYQHFGTFYLSLWTSGGQFCLYKDDRVWFIGHEDAASMVGLPPGEVGKPLTYRFPPGLVILLLGLAGLGGKWLYDRRSSAEEVETPQTLQPAAGNQRRANTNSEPPGRKVDTAEMVALASSPDDLRQERRTDSSGAESTISRLVSQDELKATLNDPVYQKAIKLVLQHASSLSGLSMDPSKRHLELNPGLEYLMEHGVDKSVARPRLMAAVRAVARAQRRRMQGR